MRLCQISMGFSPSGETSERLTFFDSAYKLYLNIKIVLAPITFVHLIISLFSQSVWLVFVSVGVRIIAFRVSLVSFSSLPIVILIYWLSIGSTWMHYARLQMTLNFSILALLVCSGVIT